MQKTKLFYRVVTYITTILLTPLSLAFIYLAYWNVNIGEVSRKEWIGMAVFILIAIFCLMPLLLAIYQLFIKEKLELYGSRYYLIFSIIDIIIFFALIVFLSLVLQKFGETGIQ